MAKWLSKNRRILILSALCAIILLYKLWILFYYNVRYVDEDQAIMWLGTVYFANGVFPEPCFWGQNYGAMVESLLAVPLYWLHVPLQVALPLGTTLFTALPIILMLCKTKDENIMLLIAGSYIVLCYKFDILLSVPRSFAMGICITAMACVGLLMAKRKWAVWICSVFAVLGIVITNTAVIPLAITGVYLLYRDRIYLWRFACYLGGGLCGAVYWLYIRWFYHTNPDYCLHKSYKMDWNISRIFTNDVYIWNIMGELNFIGIAALTLFGIVVIGVVLYKHKNYVMLSVYGVAIMATVAVFGLKKINNFCQGILLGAERMLLFIPYVLCLFWFIYDYNKKEKWNLKKNNVIITFVLIGFIIVSVFKMGQITWTLNNTELLTKTGGELRIVEVEETIEWCEHVLGELDQMEEFEWIVTLSDSRPEAYILSALGYGKYQFYNCHYDRRTWAWRECNEYKENMICGGIYLENDDSIPIMERYLIGRVVVENESLVEYLEKDLGWTRTK